MKEHCCCWYWNVSVFCDGSVVMVKVRGNVLMVEEGLNEEKRESGGYGQCGVEGCLYMLVLLVSV